MKEKLKSTLIIAGISVVVILGLYFAGCKNGSPMELGKSDLYKSAVYSDALMEESVSVRNSNVMMKSASPKAINTISGAGTLDANINLEKDSEGSQERKIIKSGSLSYEV